MDKTTNEVIEGLAEVWGSLLEATSGLTEAEWSIETACPGWSVRDQLSHLVGIERTLQGAPAPEIEVGERDHIRNAIGVMNEVWVDSLRDTPGEEVRAAFAEVTAERLTELASLPEDRFDEIGWSPIGQVPMRKFMEIRIMDSWMHEQDVRAAIGRPGGRDGWGEKITLERVDVALGVVVGKVAKAPEGSSVAFEVVGPLGGRRRIEVVDGRALSAEAEGATATITLSQETYERRFGGRISLEQALEDDSTFLDGDQELCRAVLGGLNVMI